MTTVLDTPVDARRTTAPKHRASPIEEAVAAAPAVLEAPAPSPETEAVVPVQGLRRLTGKDWLAAAGWGIAGALATTTASVLLLPVQLLALTFLLGAGLGVLGYLDHCTQLIRDKHNLVFGAAAALLLTATQVLSPGTGILLPAAIAAVAAMGFMLAVTVFTGLAGGGDIKLSPIPAALLAAVSPIAAMMWLLFTFVLCLGAMITTRLRRSQRKRLAMAPFMAIAAVLAITAYGLLSRALGI